MEDTTKTIIIGSIVTVLALIIAMVLLYKNSDKLPVKENNTSNTNNTTNNKVNSNQNNNTPVSNETNNNNTSNANSNTENDNKNNTEDNNSDNETESKVIIYLFHGATCPACQNALKNINEHKNTTLKNIEFRTFEIWNNPDNSKLMRLVANKLNVEAKYIPYFIVGNYSKDGYNEETLLKEYKRCVKDNDYKDIVAQVIKENGDLNPVYETLK